MNSGASYEKNLCGRRFHIARALRNAWENGVLLSGMSAGAVCWFDNHVALSPHAADRVPLLGFLRGTCVVHYGDRREHARSAMRSLQLPSVVAIEDDVALLYEDEQLARVIAWRADAGAYRLAWASDEIEARALLPRIAIDS